MIEVLGNADEYVQEAGYEVIEVAKKTSDEDGDNSEQLINKNSLSNDDVDMIEVPGDVDGSGEGEVNVVVEVAKITQVESEKSGTNRSPIR
ncbi:unnamed protein product [Rhizophagus irregularis]|nr:unnamed protein product [Rhizophagus irregularis]CAB5393090.1 unnamed protein product [Rhizophagus irregularis]